MQTINVIEEKNSSKLWFREMRFKTNRIMKLISIFFLLSLLFSSAVSHSVCLFVCVCEFAFCPFMRKHNLIVHKEHISTYFTIYISNSIESKEIIRFVVYSMYTPSVDFSLELPFLSIANE